MRDLFDSWADRTSRRLLDGLVVSLQAAADALPLQRGDEVLVYGVGDGELAARLSARGATITGFDRDGAALDRLQRAHPDFLLEIDSTDIPAAQFAAVAAPLQLYRLPLAGRISSIAEMMRLLQPGGYLLLLEVAFASPAAIEEAAAQLADWPFDTADHPLVADLDTLLREAGLRGLQWQQTAPCIWLAVGSL